MADKTYWDSFKAEGENVVNKIKQLVHEGNVRRVVIQHQGRSVAEFPLTAGVVGAVLAPVLADRRAGGPAAGLHDPRRAGGGRTLAGGAVSAGSRLTTQRAEG